MITEKQLSWKTEEFIPTLEDYPSTDYFCIHPLIKACKISFVGKTGEWWDENYYTMEYSFDKITWYTYTKGTVLNINSAVYFRGIDNNTSNPRKQLWKSFPYKLTASKLCYASGQLSTLVVGAPNTQVRVGDRAFSSTFEECSGLASAQYLTFDNCITKVPDEYYNQPPEYTYSKMFYRCINLQHAPALPTTDLFKGQYYQMFYGCKALLDAPDLLAETELKDYCYYEMFYDCESLTIAPKIAIKDWYYHSNQSAGTYNAGRVCTGMFQNCKRLTTPAAVNPLLTYLTYQNFLDMYNGCINLIKLPDLSNITWPTDETPSSWGMTRMFANCSKIRMSKTQHGSYTYQFDLQEGGYQSWATYMMFYNTSGEYVNTEYGTKEQTCAFGTLYTSNEIVQYE